MTRTGNRPMQAYLDNSATTRPCEAAIEAMERCMREGFYNPSSVYAPAVEAFRQERAARENSGALRAWQSIGNITKAEV